jgi:hypothetical protein
MRRIGGTEQRAGHLTAQEWNCYLINAFFTPLEIKAKSAFILADSVPSSIIIF